MRGMGAIADGYDETEISKYSSHLTPSFFYTVIKHTAEITMADEAASRSVD